MNYLTFKTETGSVYEVDLEAKLIRRADERVEHVNSRRVGHGEWKAYDHLYVRWGSRATIVWPEGIELLPGSPSDALPCTLTSRVVEIA